MVARWTDQKNKTITRTTSTSFPHHLSSALISMISETRQPRSLSIAESESRIHDQRDRAMCEGFNGKGEPVGDASGDSNVNFQKKRTRQDEDMTLQDVYNYPDGLDDDYEDSDWDPLEKPATDVKWFCVKCTMVNFDDVVHCDVCGEHKESEILKYGFFASPFSKEAGLAGPQWIEREEIRKLKASEYAPDFTIISAGFDAARGDPLGGCDILNYREKGEKDATHCITSVVEMGSKSKKL